MPFNDPLLGYAFANPQLEQLALTHPSCESPAGDNQRLEFLGDAVLGLIVSELLYARLPGAAEGTLAASRAALVKGDTLAAVAANIGLGHRLSVGESHRQHLPEPSKAMLEDAFEALVGAIYLDGGLDAARAFVTGALQAPLEAVIAEPPQSNPKSRLQEWSQSTHAGAIPDYRLLNAEGPDHQRRFEVEVRLNDQVLGQGGGSSIKAAESAAAEAALRTLNPDA